MNFVSDVLKDVNGIQWYYIIGIAIFISLFIVILYRTIKTPKKDLVQYKNAILEDDNESDDGKQNNSND